MRFASSTHGRRALIGTCFSIFSLSGCGGPVPIPDEFDAAFTSGRVCVPSRISAAAGVSTYPVRFEFCRYRCIDIDLTTAHIRSAWQCAAGQCNMMLVATAHATRVDGEKKCDARDLADPPASECTPQIFDFNVSLPNIDGEVTTGDYLVTIPYLTLEEADRMVERLEANEPTAQVIQEEAGSQNYPSRQFVVNFDGTRAEVITHDEISSEDCHDIPLP